MPISHEYKAIFIHIPKNAGESMEKKLGIYGESKEALWGVQGKYVLQHLTMLQMKRLFLNEVMFKNYFKFAFVRNPWDKAVSEYHWYQRHNAPITFKDWAKTLPGKLKGSKNLHVLEIGHNIPQYKYIYDKKGNLLVEFVGRFENLQNDFDKVCRNLGIKDSVLSNRESTASAGRKPYKEYYDIETIGIIEKIYKKDIELFNYKF